MQGMITPTLEVSPGLAMCLKCTTRYQLSIIVQNNNNPKAQFKPPVGVAGAHSGEGTGLTKHMRKLQNLRNPLKFLVILPPILGLHCALTCAFWKDRTQTSEVLTREHPDCSRYWGCGEAWRLGCTGRAKRRVPSPAKWSVE